MATMHGLTESDIATADWHTARINDEVSNLLTANAVDIIGWRDDIALLLTPTPASGDLKKRQAWGVRFWLMRFALAARLGIAPEAQRSADAARAWGARWADVGNAIGMTRQGAQQRYRTD